MKQFARKVFLALYSYLYMCIGIAIFFRDDSSVFKALDQSTGLIVFVLGVGHVVHRFHRRRVSILLRSGVWKAFLRALFAI